MSRTYLMEIGWTVTAKREFAALTLLLALVGCSTSLVLPASAIRLDGGGLTTSIVGLLLALHPAGLMLALPATRPLYRRLRAKGVLIASCVGAATTCVVLAEVHAPPLGWGFGLLCLGVCMGLVFNLAETRINTLVPDHARGRLLALHCMVFTVSQLAGPLILQVLSSEQALIGCGLGLCMIGLPCARFVSPVVADEEGISWTICRRLLLTAPAIVWGTALFGLFDSIVLTMLPLYAQAHNLSMSAALWSVSVVLAGDAVMEWPIGWMADRVGRVPMQWVCALVLLVSSASLPWAVTGWLWAPQLALVGASAGGIYVLSLMATGERFQGTRLLAMSSLLGAAWGAASCSGTLMTGVLMDLNPTWALPGVLLASSLVFIVAMKWESRGTSCPESSDWKVEEIQEKV